MDPKKLKIFLREKENLTLEFKERYSNKIDEDIVAFANTKGGVIVLGVSDEGKVIGNKLTNELKAQINNLARNCSPQIEVKMTEIGGLVVIEIGEGHEKPYSCSSGYYRRLDGNTQKMDRDEIRIMFSDNEPVPFEEKTNKNCLIKDISLDKVKRYLKEAKITQIDQDIKEILGSANVLDGNSVKNAGILLFAKDVKKFISNSRMDLIRFRGTTKVDIFDRMQVADDLLTQFDQAMFFLKKHLNTRSEIRGVNRYDIMEIPEEVLREAVANALIHRDYTVLGTSLTIEIFDDRIEVTNPGSLPRGLDKNNFGKLSVRRNELLADLFFRMDKIEKAGTGVQKMRRIMREANLPAPTFTTEGFFIAEFKRPGYLGNVPEKVGEKVGVKVGGQEGGRIGGQEGGRILTKRQKEILNLIKQNPIITREELSSKLDINQSAIQKHIEKLKQKGLLKRIGPDKGGRWEVLV